MKFGTPVTGAFGALLLCLALSSNAHADCGSPANAIERENCLPGTPQSQWDVSGAGDPSIQGFATDISVNVGDIVNFKIKTDAAIYTIDIYRMGYYQGNGARLIASIAPSVKLPQAQPSCAKDTNTTGLVDCGNWSISASWAVPSDAVSGIYFAHLIRTDSTPGESHIVFIVRNDTSHSGILFQTADETWQAYNGYDDGGSSGSSSRGSSLYGPDEVFDITQRASKVSYNRPFDTRGFGDESVSWVFGAEYPMVRWLEANAYDVSYFTGVDGARNGSLITNHKIYLTVGHDEYWSGPRRANVEAARDAGVNLAFFSGNDGFWKTRWEDSTNTTDGSNPAYRTLVCYKDTLADKWTPDPVVWTGTWRDARSPDGGRPENSLTGTLFMVNGPGPKNDGTLSIKVPAADGKLRFWRNTSVAKLASGETATLPPQTLGYEWDEDVDNGARPPGTFDLSTATYPLTDELLLDQGATYGPGTATHHMTLHRAPSGALVFGAGTVQWSWGLDSAHDDPFPGAPQAPDLDMQQATVNLLGDMGVQPGSLQSGLVPGNASVDTVAPTSTITSPINGSTVVSGSAILVSGTAQDSGGGVVGGVELSVDGGNTWHPTNGRENWTYSWTPSALGSSTLKSRSTDDSGNIEIPTSGVTVSTVVTVNPADCPCSDFTSSSIPAQIDSDDNRSVELGVRFRADFPGYITGIRFYKAEANTGTHIGHLWTNTGTPLATATFANETPSGWQQVSFDQPVAIDANTTYVASYLAPVGHYSATGAAFTNGGIDTPPLHFLATSNADGPNGVFTYNPPAFPTDSYNATNYWVDVVYIPAGSMPGAPPALLANPSKLSFVASGGGSNAPAPQNVSIYNEGAGVLQWTASASAPWLVVSPGSGSTPSSLSISVDPSTLAPGTYTGTVTVTAPGATNPPQTIPVSLTVTGVLLVANPSKLSFVASAGGSNPPAPQSISISNEGGGALQWTASSSAPWLVVSPGSGSSLSVSVETSTLALGTYTGQVTITAPGAANSPQTIPVSLTVANVLLFSNFADGTMQGWAFSPLGLSTNWSVANGALQYNGGGHTQVYAGDAGWKDYTVTAAIKLSTLHDYPGGIRGRIDPDPLSGAGYTAWMYPDEGVIKLFKNYGWNIDSGINGPNWLGQAAVAFDTTNFHNLGLSFQGNQIQVLYDGAVVITATDSTATDSTVPAGLVALDVSTQNVSFTNVTVTSATPTSDSLSLGSTSLDFSATPGTDPAAQTVKLDSTGGVGAALAWTATSSASWLSVSPAYGATPADSTPADLQVSVDSSTLASGSYSGTIKVVSLGAVNTTQTIPVSLTVGTSLTSQTITITSAVPPAQTYNTAFSVSANGGGSGNPVTFALDASSTACSIGSAVNAGGTFTTPITMTSGTGNCVVDLNQSGNANYSAAAQVQVSIAAAKGTATALTITGPTALTYGTTATATVSGGGGTGAITFSAGASSGCSVNGTTVAVTDATGSCSLTATQEGDNNNGQSTSAPFTVALNKANAVITVVPYTATYDGQAHTATGSATGVESTPANLTSLLTLSGTTHTNVGPYQGDIWSFAGNNNYNAISGTVDDNIAQGTSGVTLTFEPGPYVYRGAAFTATAQVTGTSISVPVSYSGDCINVTTANGCTATATYTGDANHAGSTGTGSITVAKANAKITVTGYSVTYDGQPHTATGTALGVESTPANLSSLLTLSGTTHTNVNAYKGDAWSFAGNNNYNAASGTVDDSIGQATSGITVAFGAGPYVYRGTAFTATAQVTGTSISVPVSYSGDCINVTSANGCTATATYAGDANHAGSTGTNSITITKANAKITVTGYSVTYDGQPHTATGTALGVESTPANLTSLLTLSGTTHTNVGAYKGDAWSFAGNNNYNATSGTVDDNIGQATSGITVAFGAGPYVYRGTAFTATAQVTGTSISVPVSYSGDCINVTSANGCTATATYAGDANHAGSTGTNSITITKANANITVTGYSVTYDGQPHTATGTALGVESTPANLSSLLTLSGTAHTNVGAYKSDAWSFAGNNNYNAASGTVDDTIGQATSGVTVAFGAGPYVYRGTAFTATAQLTGTNTSVPISYSGDCINVTSANGCTATATYAGDANHAGSTGTNSITITKANAKITVTSYNVTYDGQPHTATGTALGVESTPANLSSLLTLSGTTHTNGGTYLGDLWSFAGNNNYNAATGTVDDSIGQLAPIITWANPADIVSGTQLSATQLNATANVNGTFIYTHGGAPAAAGTVLNAGLGQELTVTFTPADTADYAMQTAMVHINVLNTATGTNVPAQAAAASITFSDVTTPGMTSSKAIDPSTAGQVPNSYVVDPTMAYDLTTTATFSGPVQVCFTVTSVTDPNDFATLRVLHGENRVLVDRTILAPDSPAPDFSTKTVCARVDSLSPFLVARVSDTTPPTIAIAAPTATSYLLNQSIAASYTCTDSGSGVNSCSGTVDSGTAIDTSSAGQKTFTVTATDKTRNTATQSVTYTVGKGTPSVNWSNPAPIGYGTALSATQLNATSNVPGTFVYDPPAGTVLGPGSQTLSVTFTPTDTTDYTTAPKTSVVINVKASTSVSVSSNLNPSTYGQQSPQLAFTATVTGTGGTPTGTVTFWEGGAQIGTAQLSGGSGSFPTATLNAGTHSITATYSGDGTFASSSSLAFTQTVNKASATATFTFTPTSQQYSDQATFKATLASVNGASPATSAQFKVASQIMGSRNFVLNSTTGLYEATLTVPLLETSPTGQLSPGSKQVTASFTSTNYSIPNRTGSLGIRAEDVRTYYAGQPTYPTNPAASTATIPLQWTIKDITAVGPSDAAYDPYAGDITLANVTFINRTTGATIATVPVTASTSDKTAGTASYNWAVDLGTATSQTYTVGVIVGGHYTRNNTSENATISVNKQ